MLLKAGAHWLTISITLLEFCNILLALCTKNDVTGQTQLKWHRKMLSAHSSEIFKANTYSGYDLWLERGFFEIGPIYMSSFVKSWAIIGEEIVYPIMIRANDEISVDPRAS